MTSPINSNQGYSDIPTISIEEALQFPLPENFEDNEQFEDIFPLQLDDSEIVTSEFKNKT